MDFCLIDLYVCMYVEIKPICICIHKERFLYQVPQFLYEASFSEAGRKMIGITQPRRVAVTSTAQRVRYEMGSAGGCVGYQVRFDSVNIGPSTCIKYMTDGILLKEISHQLLLPDYSVIILDEAHERNINTDVLLGMLSRLGQFIRFASRCSQCDCSYS